MTEHSIPNSTITSNIDAAMDGRFDVFSRLLKDRIIVLGTDVNDEVANYISAQMLFLESQDSEKTHLAIHQLSWRFSNFRNGHL